jgi:hypothetical protein
VRTVVVSGRRHRKGDGAAQGSGEAGFVLAEMGAGCRSVLLMPCPRSLQN